MLFEKLTVGASACVTDITKLLLSPSVKQHRNPCSGPPAEYQDLSKRHDWPVKKAIFNFPMKIKQNLKCTFGNLLSPLGTQTIGSITSHCSGNESILLPWTNGWTYKCMSLLLSITTNQIVACSNPAGTITLCSWSRFQTVDAKVLFYVACNRFKTLKTEIFTKKSVILEKLANDKYVFEIQPIDCGSLIIFQSVTMVVES